MFFRLNCWIVLSMAFCSFYSLPVRSESTAMMNLDSNIYKFDKAWLEITDSADLTSSPATEQIYNSAILFIRHLHKSSYAQRLIHIPLSVHIRSMRSASPPALAAGTYKIHNLEGKTLSALFGGLKTSSGTSTKSAEFQNFENAHGIKIAKWLASLPMDTILTLQPGSIDPDDMGLAYIIDLESEHVDAVPVESLLEIQM